MPLSKDKGHGGTELDGLKSQEYCSHCYKKGKFIDRDITLSEMKVKVKEKMKAMHIPGFLVGYFTKDMHKLKRWAN